MAILIGIWDVILVLLSIVLLTTLALWWYCQRRLDAVEKEYDGWRGTELSTLREEYDRRLEAELTSLREEYARRNQTEIDEMIGTFDHHAVNLLWPVKTDVHLIKSVMATRSVAEVEEWDHILNQSLADIEEYEWRLTRFIKNMRFVSCLEAPDHSLPFSEVKLDVILSDVVREYFRDPAVAKGIGLVWWARPERFPRITANDVSLRHVFINLIDNAIKYCGEKDEIDVALEAREEKNVIYIRVSDTGPGIPAEDLERIFEKGYTVQGPRGRSPKGGGQGLGLYIAKLVVEKHGGTIDVTSELGKGTTFTIILPIQRI